MEDEGNIEKARFKFYKEKPTNLFFLLEKRFSWMNKFLHQKRMERVGRLIKRLCKPEPKRPVKSFKPK